MTPSVRFLLRYPDVVRHRTACASASASRCMRVRAISSSSSQGHIELVKRKTKSLKTRTRVLSCELPSLSVDASGKPRAGLGKWNERHGGIAGIAIPPSRTAIPSLSPATAPVEPRLDWEAAFLRAVEAGELPGTDLSKVVYKHRMRFPDAIVLTRVGKFYESYFGPALYLSDILNIKLAYKRYKLNNDKSSLFPFSGFPHTQLDKYLKILVQDLGHTVVLVEEYQRESAADLLPRQVGRVVTPGTLVDESWMNGDESRYLLAIAVGDTTPAVRKGENVSLALSLAYTDVSTGEFFAKDTTLAQMEDELARIAPREVVLDKSLKKLWLAQTDKLSSSDDEKGTVEDLLILLRVLGVHVSFADPYQPPELDRPAPFADLPAPYPSSLEGLAISLLRHHLQFALRDSMPELPSEPNRQFSSEHMQIDAATLHALEIRHAIRPGGLVTANESRGSSPLSARGTLLSVLNATITPSGHRLLIRSLTTPSTSLNVINSRLALVQAFVDREELRTELRGMIKSLGDIVRIVQRFRARGGDGRNIWEVGRWIRAVSRVLDRIRHELSHETSLSATGEKRSKGVTRLQDLLSLFRPLDKLLKRIEESIDEEAVLRGLEAGENSEEAEGEEVRGEVPEEDQPLPKKKSDKNAIKREVTELAREEKEDLMWWIRPNFSLELKRLHEERERLKAEKYTMQAELRRKYEAESVMLTKDYRTGYHVTVYKKSESIKIAKSRQFQTISEGKQTSAYTYNKWSALGARREALAEEIMVAQYKAFRELRDFAVKHGDAIQYNAGLADELDVCMGFAETAVELDYVRPIMTSGIDLNIVNGRHPSVESGLLSSARTFTPNSTIMLPASHLHVITGPNQGGKSTLLRQTAIIAILAQAGSFVPADHAEIGVVDKVFSRVGARDDLFRDRSTFMLEMVETAAILRNATSKSLVIMDEIGRGTTLQAGVSIAFATLDYILSQIRCRTLFATHYHELAEMLRDKAGMAKEGVEFWCTDVDEVDGGFSYSYRLRPGINRNSHAIRAAQLAGMPQSFLKIAQDTLTTLQEEAKTST